MTMKDLLKDPEWRKDLSNIISESVKQELPLIVHKAVNEELNRHPLRCQFIGLRKEDAALIGEYYSLLSKRHEGKLAEYLEVNNENQKWLTKQRLRSDKVSTAFVICMVITTVGAVMSGIGATLWYAVKQFIKVGGSG